MVVIYYTVLCVIGYGKTPKVTKSKYKIHCYFMDSSLIFQFFVYKCFNLLLTFQRFFK